jgi:hypothetical protein
MYRSAMKGSSPPGHLNIAMFRLLFKENQQSSLKRNYSKDDAVQIFLLYKTRFMTFVREK